MVASTWDHCMSARALFFALKLDGIIQPNNYLFDVVNASEHANAAIIQNGQLFSQLWVGESYRPHGGEHTVEH